MALGHKPTFVPRKRNCDDDGEFHLSPRKRVKTVPVHVVPQTPRRRTPYPPSPSDSPSNPLGPHAHADRARGSIPPPTSLSRHVVLRFQLVHTPPPPPHNRGQNKKQKQRQRQKQPPVYRIVRVPLSYTFLHLRFLIAWLFHLPGPRQAEWAFQVHHQVAVYSPLYKPGQIKSGRVAVNILGSQHQQQQKEQAAEDGDEDEEQEWKHADAEDFTLGHAFPRGIDAAIGIICNLSSTTQIHMTVNKSVIPRQKGRANMPFVFSALGSVGDIHVDEIKRRRRELPLPKPVFSKTVGEIVSSSPGHFSKGQVRRVVRERAAVQEEIDAEEELQSQDEDAEEEEGHPFDASHPFFHAQGSSPVKLIGRGFDLDEGREEVVLVSDSEDEMYADDDDDDYFERSGEGKGGRGLGLFSRVDEEEEEEKDADGDDDDEEQQEEEEDEDELSPSRWNTPPNAFGKYLVRWLGVELVDGGEVVQFDDEDDDDDDEVVLDEKKKKVEVVVISDDEEEGDDVEDDVEEDIEEDIAEEDTASEEEEEEEIEIEQNPDLDLDDDDDDEEEYEQDEEQEPEQERKRTSTLSRLSTNTLSSTPGLTTCATSSSSSSSPFPPSSPSHPYYTSVDLSLLASGSGSEPGSTSSQSKSKAKSKLKSKSIPKANSNSNPNPNSNLNSRYKPYHRLPSLQPSERDPRPLPQNHNNSPQHPIILAEHYPNTKYIDTPAVPSDRTWAWRVRARRLERRLERMKRGAVLVLCDEKEEEVEVDELVGEGDAEVEGGGGKGKVEGEVWDPFGDEVEI